MDSILGDSSLIVEMLCLKTALMKGRQISIFMRELACLKEND